MLFHALLPCMIFVLLMQGDDTNILTKELGYLKTIWWSYSVQRKKWAVINKTDTKKKRIFCVNCHFSPGHHQSSHVCLNKEEFSFLPNSSFFALFVIHCVAWPVCMKVAAVSTGSFFENNNNRQQQQVQQSVIWICTLNSTLCCHIFHILKCCCYCLSPVAALLHTGSTKVYVRLFRLI